VLVSSDAAAPTDASQLSANRERRGRENDTHANDRPHSPARGQPLCR
jgi:hypothetical protein